MYCIKCGFKNVEEAAFCANCGSVMTKRPSDAENRKIQSDEMKDSVEKNNMEEVRQTVSEVQAEQPEKSQDLNRVQPVEQVESSETDSTKVSLAKTEVVQSGDMNNENGNADVSADLYHSTYTRENTGNNHTYRIRKFSVPRFIFSFLILLATACSIVTIAFKYVGVELTMEVSVNGYDESETEYKNIKGYKIIKERKYIDGEEKLLKMLEERGGDSDKFVDTRNTFRYFIIAFAVAILVFCIIDLLLLCLVRNRIAYIVTMIFAFIKAALGGIAIYIWSVEILNRFKEVFELSLNNAIDAVSYRILLECAPGIGLILALVMQAVIIVSAVVLLCIKPKYQEVAPQTISA